MPKVILKRSRRGPSPRSQYWKGDPAKLIMRALQETPTYAAAAEKLGISQSTLYRYLRRYDIRPIWDDTNKVLIFDS